MGSPVSALISVTWRGQLAAIAFTYGLSFELGYFGLQNGPPGSPRLWKWMYWIA